jgi:hypothetical protein
MTANINITLYIDHFNHDMQTSWIMKR